jgi:hypothetical protein
LVLPTIESRERDTMKTTMERERDTMETTMERERHHGNNNGD